MEILPIITYAQQIAIDSINGFLYWSTLTSLRISLLNGMKHSQHLLIRTSQINALSIDENEMKLYWLTYNSGTYSSANYIDGESSSTLMLYQMPLFKTLNEIEQFQNSNLKMIKMFPIVQPNNLIGPLAVFAGQFWWLDSDNRRMMISDDTAHTFASVRQISDINAFKIITNRSAINMAKLSHYQVIPDSVDLKFIKIIGSWENFTIKWLPVTNVNYGQVFYELSLENLYFNHTIEQESWPSRSNFILNETEFILPNYLKPPKPYSKIRIGIRSFTYWCSAKQVVVTLHTPSSVPSKPRSVRVFSYSMNNAIDAIMADNINTNADQFMADARWSEPENPNGPIISYTISLWTVGGGTSQQYRSKTALNNNNNNNNVISIINKVIGNELHYKFYNLKANCTYYFQVRATTDVGEGPPSDVIQFKTFNSHPPMRLLLASRDSIYEADMDLLNIRPIIKSFSPFIIDYSLADDRLYFVEDGDFLKSTKLKNNIDEDNENNNNNYTVLAHFSQTITSMSVDWISRRIYLSSVDVMQNVSTIWVYQPETGTKVSLFSIVGKRVQTLRVDPFRSMLIWSEQVPIYSTIQMNKAKQLDHTMVSYRRCNLSINGTLCSTVANYFQSPKRQRLCNCTHTPSISTVFLLLPNQNNYLQRSAQSPQSSLLLSTLSAQAIIYFDLLGQTFIKSIDGCYCQRITSYIDTNLPPQSIQFDESNNKLYWINESVNAIIYSTQLTMASLDTDFRQPIEKINLSLPTRAMIQIVNQPFPKQFHCLIPNERFQIKMNLLEQTSTTLKLSIDLDRSIQSNENPFRSLEYSNCPSNMQISLANIRYRIHYRTINNDKIQYSNVLETYNQTLTLTNLQPYTNYSFSIECDNYYYQLFYNRTRKQIEIAQNASLVPIIPKMTNMIDLKSSIIESKFSYFFNETFIFGTSETRPAPPRNVHAIVQTPERIFILWDEPERLNAQKVIYEIRWYSIQGNKKEKYLNGDIQSWQSDGNRLLNGTFGAYLDKIQPGQQYSVTVRAYAIEQKTIDNAVNGFEDNFFNDHHHFQDSAPIIIKSYNQPSDLQLKHSTSRQIVLTWQSPIEQIIDEHEIWYQLEQPDKGTTTNWTRFAQDETMPSNQYQYQIKHLKPFSWYRFKLILTYRPSRFQYEWPKEPKIFRVQTNMTVPEGPSMIVVEKINMNQPEQSNELNVYKVVWDPVQSNSDSVVYYQLYKLQLVLAQYQYSNQPNETKTYSLYSVPQSKTSIGLEQNSNHSGQSLIDSATKNGWTLVYNGTDTHWIISGLETGGQYHFRLYASNRIGVNDREWAQTVQLFRFEDQYRLYPTLSSLTQNEPSIIIVIFFIIGIVSLCILGLSYYSRKLFPSFNNLYFLID